MKKVLVFGITDNPGGVESVIMNYYRNIDRKKIQFDFLCNTEIVAYEDEIKKLGGTIYRVTARSKDRKKFYQDLDEFFKNHSNEYIAIWVNVCSLANIDYLKYAKKYGIKRRIIHCHNARNMDSKLRGILHLLNRIVLHKYATDFWTCNRKSNAWFYSRKIIKSNKIIEVNNAIDTKVFKFDEKIREEYRKKLGLENKFVIGHVGRFHFQKNQLFLLDIFNEVHKREPNSTLILVGQGEDAEKITNKIDSLGLKDSIMLLGIRDDVNKLMCAMDVFLFPSLFEGLGIVLLEAQATRLPCVASCDDTPPEVNMTDEFIFLPLDASIGIWAGSVLDFKNTKRKTNNDFIKKNNYDISCEAKKLEKYFERS